MFRMTLACAVLAAWPLTAFAGDFVGMKAQNGELFSIDTSAGSATSLGVLGGAPAFGFSVMDRGPNGRLFAISPGLITGYSVYEIDEGGLTANLLFQVSSPMSGNVGAAVSPSGNTIWVAGFRSLSLRVDVEEVDLATGVPTSRGSMGGNLWGLAFDGNGDLFTSTQGTTDPDLIRVDQTNAANSTVVGTMTGINYNMGLDLASERASATISVISRAADTIYTVDTASAGATQLGSPLAGGMDVTTIAGTSCAFVIEYGAGCAGSGGFVPTLSVGGCPAPGTQLSIDLANGLGGSTAAVVFGLGQIQVPIGGGCDVLVNPIGVNITLALNGSGPGQGSYSLPIVLPIPLPPGTFVLQGVCIDPGATLGFTLTNAVQVTFP
ncbi:MAG: hypothetical protein H6834_05225 [Planctomycetes bacterium]|nr:hypothetical protein [Planctomycetota bacterium]